MTDKLSPEHRSRNMAAIRSKDMKPERIVRSLVHGMGYRYRLHRKGLPGKPDLVFGPKRRVIFVHGCFWHQHEDPACKITRKPKSNLGYWNEKLSRNMARDQRNQAELEGQGWSVLIIWECETKDAEALKAMLKRFLSP
ncbi:MAG: very short patch repair endonuclease [Glycocaulis sp.]